MSSSKQPLSARNLAEAHLYLKINPCAQCGTGSVEVVDTTLAPPGSKDVAVRLQTICRSCNQIEAQEFVVRTLPQDLSLSNLTLAGSGLDDEPSTLIDVGQWVVLSSTFMHEALHENDKLRARSMKIEAAACLEQALRMYDDPGNDLPPAYALFRDSTRQRFRNNPELFSRQRLINMRAALPSVGALERPGDSRPNESEESPPSAE